MRRADNSFIFSIALTKIILKDTDSSRSNCLTACLVAMTHFKDSCLSESLSGNSRHYNYSSSYLFHNKSIQIHCRVSLTIDIYLCSNSRTSVLLLTLGACAGGLRYLVCPSVHLSVCPHTNLENNGRHQRH